MHLGLNKNAESSMSRIDHAISAMRVNVERVITYEHLRNEPPCRFKSEMMLCLFFFEFKDINSGVTQSV